MPAAASCWFCGGVEGLKARPVVLYVLGHRTPARECADVVACCARFRETREAARLQVMQALDSYAARNAA